MAQLSLTPTRDRAHMLSCVYQGREGRKMTAERQEGQQSIAVNTNEAPW